MSRRTRERRLEAGERWPNLQRLLHECFDEVAPDRPGSAETALDQAIGRRTAEALKVTAIEWWNWNSARSWGAARSVDLADGFGVDGDFPEPMDARQFMNAVYDKLIVAIRAEAGSGWRPDPGFVKAD